MKIILLSTVLLLSITLSAQKRYYFTGNDMTVDSVLFLDENPATVAIEVRCALQSVKEESGRGRSWWGIAWNYRSSSDYDYVVLRPFNTDFGAIDDRRVMAVEYGSMTDGDFRVYSEEVMTSGINMAKGFNSLLLEWGNGVMRVFAGSKELHKVMELGVSLPESRECRIVSSSAVDIASVVLECGEDKVKNLTTDYEMEVVMKRLELSVDPMEGIWCYLDRETDDSRARLGGQYKVIILGNGNGYDILYYGGARVNESEWKPLMLKGALSPTPFQRNYNLVWHDSMMERMDEELHATLSEEGILSFEFPIYRSRLRFFRMTEPKP